MTKTIPWSSGGGNITLTFNQSEGNQSIVLTADSNSNMSARSQSITFRCGDITKSLLVRQEGKQAVQKTIEVNASASLSANGTSTANGTITWSVPSLPSGVSSWDSVYIRGTWSWGGKGSISRVTINGTNTSTGVAFNINIAGKTSPLSITCVGNKNATGSSFTWSNLKVTYTYTI